MLASSKASIDTDAVKRAHDLAGIVEAELGSAPVRSSSYKQWTCPFHAGDNTPSLTVYPDGHYHCFGCGAHGDIITWTMQRQALTFVEACRELGAPFPDRRAKGQPALHASTQRAAQQLVEATPHRDTVTDTRIAA